MAAYIRSNNTEHGLVCHVTGAGQPLGNAIGRRFAAAGARVAFVCFPEDEAAACAAGAASGAEMVIPCDPVLPKSVSATVRRVAAEMGSVDLLVNASRWGTPKRLEDTSLAECRQIVEVQLSGTIYFCKEVIRPMMRARAGRIISMLDIASGGACMVAAKG